MPLLELASRFSYENALNQSEILGLLWERHYASETNETLKDTSQLLRILAHQIESSFYKCVCMFLLLICSLI